MLAACLIGVSYVVLVPPCCTIYVGYTKLNLYNEECTVWDNMTAMNIMYYTTLKNLIYCTIPHLSPFFAIKEAYLLKNLQFSIVFERFTRAPSLFRTSCGWLFCLRCGHLGSHYQKKLSALRSLKLRKFILQLVFFRGAILVLPRVGLRLCSEAGRVLEHVIKYPPAPSARGMRLRNMVDTFNIF